MQAMVAAKCEFVATMSSIPDALATVVDSRVTELYLESIASGIDGGGFKKRIAECEKPMLAAALLAETRHRVDTFGMKNPKAFGTMLKAQLGAIHTRINCVVQENKHAKQNEYLLTPKGGWLRAVKERIDAEKKRIAAERGATK